MAARPDQLPYERRLRDLEAVYASAQQTIAARVEAALRSGDLAEVRRMRMQLASVVAVLDQTHATVIPIARQLVADAYQQSAKRVVRQITALNISAPEIPGAFAGVSREAVAQLQASLLERLDSSMQTLGRKVADVYAREQRMAALRAILGANGSPERAARDLALRLQRDKAVSRLVQQGGVGFVDRAGKRWQLDTYSRMATRTVTREAVVQGAMARMVSHGIDLARVSDHATACPICKPMEGRLVSLSGDITEYEGEAVMSTGDIPPFHPNCEHSLQPIATAVEAVKTEMQAAGGH